MFYFGLVGILAILQFSSRKSDALPLSKVVLPSPYYDRTFELTTKGYTFFVEDHHVARIEPLSRVLFVEQVNLSNTMQLPKWSPGLFDFAKEAKVLDLSSNSITKIPTDGFKGFKKLESLYLSNNHLNRFDNSPFSNLSSIKHLDLTKNYIKNLYAGNLFGLGNTTDILISGNDISSISTHLFVKPEPEIENKQPIDDSVYKKLIEYPNFHAIEYIRIKVCVREGTLERMENLMNNETLEAFCNEVLLMDSFNKIDMNGLGIVKFSTGWYRLNIPDREFELFFRGNNITDLPSEMLNNLPQDVKVVDLSYNKIKRLTKGSMTNYHLRHLTLSSNLISEIEDGAFENTNLTEINLSDNRLKNLNFVATLPSNMTLLFLAKNEIEEILPDTFSKLPELQALDLSSNRISEIKNNSLRGLIKLRTLNFADNKIKTIESGAFHGFKNLFYFDIQNNNLADLQVGTFDGIEFLGYCDLSYNNFTKITKDYFPETLSINQLKMSGNQIEVLQNGTFPKKEFFSLVLRDNKIKKIEQGALKIKCDTLDLGNNLWSQPEEKIFEDISDLRSLNLENNGIQKIEKGFAKHFKDLHELDLSHNPIRTLNNGALFGLQKSKVATVKIINTPIELIQGGLFEDV